MRTNQSPPRGLARELGKRLLVLLAAFAGGAVPPWVLMNRWPNWFGQRGDPGDIDYYLVALLATNVGLLCGGLSMFLFVNPMSLRATPRLRIAVVSLCVAGIGALSALLVSVIGTSLLLVRS